MGRDSNRNIGEKPNLLVDTSWERSLLGLGRGGKVFAWEIIPPRLTSRRIFPVLGNLLKKTNLSLFSLGSIIVSLGPGSFTGLRVGLSLGKSLSFVLKKNLFGIPTLDSWTFSSRTSFGCGVMPAYGGKVYGRFFSKEGKEVIFLSEILFLGWEELVKEGENFLKGREKMVFLTREKKSFSSLLDTFSPPYPFSLEEIDPLPGLLRLGETKLREGKKSEISTLTPLYISSPFGKDREYD